jgi:hypothetical protein
VDPKDATSAWITARRRALRALHNVLGESPYEAHEGSNTGGANGIYWVEVVGERPGGLSIVANITEGAKRAIPKTQAAIETDLLYPLLRGRDVGRWSAAPSAHILMAQDPKTRRGIAVETMEKRYPKAHSYLSKFEKILRSRPAFRRYFRPDDPYWSMFNVSLFTFAPWKVVWRYIATEMVAAVIGPSQSGKPVIPDCKLMLCEVESKEEAFYLCGALNSAPANLAVKSYTVSTQISTHVLNNINIPKFSASNRIHQRLATLSEAAHRAVAKGDSAEVARIEEEIDRTAARLWGLSDDDLAEIKRSLEEM